MENHRCGPGVAKELHGTQAGKGLDERVAEVRVRFKPAAYNALMAASQSGGEVDQSAGGEAIRAPPCTSIFSEPVTSLFFYGGVSSTPIKK